MEIFFLEYRDPIFGLIVFIATILLVSILSYLWGLFIKKTKDENIEKFIKNFENQNGLSTEHITLLNSLDINPNSLATLANVFAKSGDFDKAINVYLIALKKADLKQSEFLLTNLGKIYFKAGFLERAKNTLLEALKLSPRNSEALKILGVVYEKLKLYKEQFEVLDALKEQGFETKFATSYTKALETISKNYDLKTKFKILTEISKEFEAIKRLAFELFLKNKDSNFTLFPKANLVVDILFRLKEPLNLQDDEYRQIFAARMLVNGQYQGDDFNIKAYEILRKNGNVKPNLSFSYVCKSCKNTFPVFFYRCPSCYELDLPLIVSQISKEKDEDDLPF